MYPIILPKGYLSPSQMDLWKKSKTRYIAEYFLKGRKLKTRYLEFGNAVHQMIEEGTYKAKLPKLKVYAERELEIRTTINGVPVFFIIDGYDPEPDHVFGDYKTGKRAWTQAKVQKHEQFLFYATGLRTVMGVMPRYCETHWLETKEDDEIASSFWQEDRQLQLTGHIGVFRRYFDSRECDRMEAEILKVATEISDAYREFINEI